MSSDSPLGLELTPEQRAPMSVRGSSVALSAGAGCGKTTVLTERFLRLLDGPDRLPIRSVVALTFTEKAARQLRDKVRDACRDRLSSGADPAHWRSILRALEAAPIGTFHGYCASLLRRFPIEAGVEPGFAILEESIAPTLRAEALDRRVRSWLADHDAGLTTLAVEFGLPAVRDTLADLVAGRGQADFGVWAEREPAEVVAIWDDIFQRRVRPIVLDGLTRSAGPLLDLLQAHDCAHPTMRQRINFLREHLPTLPACRDPEALLESIREHSKIQGGGSKKDWPTVEIYEAVRDALKAFRDEIDDARQALTYNPEATRDAARLGVQFARLARGAVEEFDLAKRELGLLDYDDLLLKTRDLLRIGPGNVRATLREEIGLILVDEFQDTDPVQAEIIEMLSGEDSCIGRLFLVGDPKQSIYRFRGAQPQIFGSHRARFPEPGRLALTENFRSVPGVIHFVNALFADTFPEADHRLKPALDSIGDGPAVEFLWATEPDVEKQPIGPRRKVEGRWIARLLAARLAAGWMIRDPKSKQPRPAHAGDVTILFRTLNDAPALESALAAEGIDYYVVGGSAYFAQQEVIDLINVLSAIENPLDPIALAGALRGPFFCVSDNGLYWLATARGGDLPAAFEHWEALTELPPRDRRRIARAHRLLSSWRSRKDRVPIAGLLDRALEESGFEAALMGEFLGDRKRANVRKLVRMARAFDARGGYTLADFVARLRADLRRPPREEQASTTDEHGSAVRLMSIHQAKGLEFPIVIVPDLDRVPSAPGQKVAFHSELGPVVRPPESPDGTDPDGGTIGPGLGWSAYRILEAAAEDEEALRLFYVAATRARDALILTASLAATDRPHSPALCLLATRFDRATGACIAELPDALPVPEVRVVADRPDAPPRLVPARPRPRPFEVARRIISARPAADVRRAVDFRPGWIDLDPAGALGPTAARRDRLIRAILADPKGLDPKSLAAVAARVGRAQVPMAPPSLVAEASDQLLLWIASPLGRELARSRTLRRALDWSLAWPLDPANPVVVRGRIDFAERDARGSWRLVLLSDVEAPEPNERLRALLSARAAEAIGLAPLGRVWLVRLGPGGGLRPVDEPGDEAIERAFRAVQWESFS